MVRAGRISLVLLLSLCALLALGTVLFFFKGESYTQAASRFMDALARADTANLAKLSYIDGNDEATLKTKWDQTMKYSSHFKFTWSVKTSTETGADSAVVTLNFWRAPDLGGYEEKFELPMLKKNGQWLVDVRGISRQMFPALPR